MLFGNHKIGLFLLAWHCLISKGFPDGLTKAKKEKKMPINNIINYVKQLEILPLKHSRHKFGDLKAVSNLKERTHQNLMILHQKNIFWKASSKAKHHNSNILF